MSNDVYSVYIANTKPYKLADYDGICRCCGAIYAKTIKDYENNGGNIYGIVLMPGKQEPLNLLKKKYDKQYHITTKNGDITFVIAVKTTGK